MNSVTLLRLLTNLALRRLVLHGVSADDVVSFFEDGPEIDDAEESLRLLSDVDNEEVSLIAQQHLADLLAARARRCDA